MTVFTCNICLLLLSVSLLLLFYEPDLVKMNRLLIFEWLNCCYPNYVLSWIRYKANKLFVNLVHHSFAKLCIRHELIRLLNETPNIIKDKVHTHSQIGFFIYIKQYFINTYEITCQIVNCYTCNSQA